MCTELNFARCILAASLDSQTAAAAYAAYARALSERCKLFVDYESAADALFGTASAVTLLSTHARRRNEIVVIIASVRVYFNDRRFFFSVLQTNCDETRQL